MRRLSGGLASAAVLIGVLTVLARIAGFGRTAVFSRTVESGCLSQVYFAANQIPNIVFEIVAGGALASMVVPVLAGPIERGERDVVRRTASAMLTWVVLALVPLSLLVAVTAEPIMRWLLGGDAGPGCVQRDLVSVGTDMLVVFAPQILLYGVAVVLYGVLQAHRRFTIPATAPLVSSLVVIVAYLLFVPLGADYRLDLAGLPKNAELTLSVGTTLGVVALVVCAVAGVRALRIGFRPSLRFPDGMARRAGGLAVAGLATVVAQQLATLAVVRLSLQGTGGRGTAGALAEYNYAWAVFLLPWAILAVPIATSAFPVLSARTGDAGGFDRVTAATTRAVVLVSCLGVAVLVAVAVPVASLFVHGADTLPYVLSRAILGFAPGLVGYGLVAHLGRVLFACGRGRASAVAIVTGWLTVLAADLILVPLAPRAWVVGVLGWGNTIGMTVAGVLLLAALVRARGRGALAGLGRVLLTGGLGAVGGAVAGYSTASWIGTGGQVQTGLSAIASALAAGLGFLVPTLLIDRDGLRAALVGRAARDV
ncbi:MAG: lipid II flippase MurJ [Streptosporangiaceae bacterium]